MLFDKIFFKFKKNKSYQKEYIDLIQFIVDSPLWNGTDEQIREYLPKDLTIETINHVKNRSKTLS